LRYYVRLYDSEEPYFSKKGLFHLASGIKYSHEEIKDIFTNETLIEITIHYIRDEDTGFKEEITGRLSKPEFQMQARMLLTE
jgi:hypothetical protein